MRDKGVVPAPFTALYRPFLKPCTVNNKAVEIIWRSKIEVPRDVPRVPSLNLHRLKNESGTALVFGPELFIR